MPSEIDIYRSAKLLINQHGEDAARRATRRAATLLEGGDMEGRRVWLSILEAIWLRSGGAFSCARNTARVEVPEG